MRRRVLSIVAGSAAAALALGLTAMSASAAPQEWIVDPGGEYTGVSGTTVLTNTANGVTLDCSGSEASGELAGSASGAPAQLGTIDNISWTSCSGPLGLTFEVVPQNLPWSINGESYADGVTTGYIGGIVANLTGPGCDATVEGEAPGTYDNDSDTLAPKPIDGSSHTLTVTAVNSSANCFGLINVGDNVTFEGAYVVTPGQDVTLQ
ncbi:hypothetical protein [Saccharomonospora sp. NB11]|jgi:hypothetical protein|uniref:hypothetical protein n=1 Tax=Saccharomonospora sp. NB11 TaxID=1642298 RepID=UPI0018D1B13C|nr:hypothetical protein [Saccharomonospora sp. NB11]